MTGFILREKGGIYQAVCNYTDAAGKYRQKSISTKIPAVKGNRRRAEKVGRKLIDQWLLEEAKNQRGKNTVSLSDAIQYYLDAKRETVQPTTFAGYERLCNSIVSLVGDIDIDKIDNQTIDDLKNELKKRDCSEKTVRQYFIQLNGIFRHAEKAGLSLSEPGLTAELPKTDRYRGAGYYSPAEVRELLAAADNSSIRIPVYIASYLGLRRSEIAGLRWDNVDLNNRLIRICEKRVQYDTADGYVIDDSDKMKTDASNRILPIPDALYSVLAEETDKTGYLCKLNGAPMQPAYISNAFQKLLRKAGLRKIRFHDLRHTCASLLLQSGVSMKTVQTILGHGNYSTTADIYSHVDLAEKRDAAVRLNQLL